jgi:hypothetical protein
MKFYKITNEEECHYGLQYHDGLVEDILPFNPTGSCTPGGIYFASEDIPAFLHYGPWIREVTIPEDAQVYKNPGSPNKWKADKVLLGPRRRIDISVIKALIEEGADPKADGSLAIQWAARNGYMEIVELLLPYSYPEADDSGALRWAAHNGYLEIVKILLPYSDPKAGSSCALSWAAQKGHLEIVQLLLPYSDPKACSSSALYWAMVEGHQRVVDLLLPVSDIRCWPTVEQAMLEKYRRFT